jgi:colanic acid biosynthesis glycosyl transferase WcaI
MKFTILTQYYPPEVGAAQNRLSHLASHLVSLGHEVTILTAMPNYPTGRIHVGYGGLLKHEWQGQVRVIRTFIYPSQSASLVPRLLNYLSFLGSSAILGSFLLKTSDYLLVESPPLLLGLAGVWLSRVKKAKLIFNVSDLWPESAVRLGVIRERSFAHRLSLRLESFCYHHAWIVTGQSQSILQDIEQRFPGQRTLLLSNGADTSIFHPQNYEEETRRLLTAADEFVVLYAGLHGLAQGLDQILEGAKALQSEGGYRFVFIGDGPCKQRLVLRAKSECIQNATFMDSIASSDMPRILLAADLIIVPLGLHIPGAVPSKLYEAMASERPIVLVANGEAADIVQRHKAGIVVTPGHISSLVDAIRNMRSDRELAAILSRNARLAAVKYFDRTQIARAFAGYLESGTFDRTNEAARRCEATARL